MEPVVSDVFRAVQGYDAVALHVPFMAGGAYRGSLAITIKFRVIAKRFFEQIGIGEDGLRLGPEPRRDGAVLPGPGGTPGAPSSKRARRLRRRSPSRARCSRKSAARWRTATTSSPIARPRARGGTRSTSRSGCAARSGRSRSRRRRTRSWRPSPRSGTG